MWAQKIKIRSSYNTGIYNHICW